MKNLSYPGPRQSVHQVSVFHHNHPLKKDGILLIDKPSGVTSHDVVDKVRDMLSTQKVGHSGTLDPLASGLMVLLINQGTKLSPYLLNNHKMYTVSVTLGIETDTWDRDGKVIDRKDVWHLSCEVIQKGIEKMTGTKVLRVPAYSAVKFKGKKLYDYARKHAKDGKTKVPEIYRYMSFDQVQIIDICPPHFKVSLRTSKGSFVRSWVYTIGQYLKVGGIVNGLQRTVSEPYTLDQATNLEALRAYFQTSNKKDDIPGFILLDDTLQDWPEYVVRGRWEKALSHGRIPEGMQWDIKHLLEKNTLAKGVKVYSARTGHILVLLKYNDIGNKLKVACLFNEIVK